MRQPRHLRRRAALRALCWTASGVAVVVATGCATVPEPEAAGTSVPSAPPVAYNGRLSLQVATDPPQRFAAEFDLQGRAAAGFLRLSTPLGQTLADLVWNAQGATLQGQGQLWQDRSVDALLQRLTGAAVPVAALIDWLGGVATSAEGWQVDLSGHAQRRIQAQRLAPAPLVDLRLVLSD